MDGGSVLSVRSQAPSLAKERVLRRAIRLLTAPTGSACPAGSAWVSQGDRRADLRRLRGDGLAPLAERPGMPLVTLVVAKTYPVWRPAQGVECAGLAGYDGVLNQLRAARVGQASLTGRCVDPLQPLATPVGAATHEGNPSAGEALTFAVRRQIDDTEVHTQRTACWLLLCRSLAALCHAQIVDAAAPDQSGPVTVSRWVYQHPVLTRAQEQAADDAAFPGVEGDPVKTQQLGSVGVVANTPTRTESGAGVAFLRGHCCARFHRHGAGAHCQLRAHAEGNAGPRIHPMMRGVGSGDARIPAHPRHPAGRRVEGAWCRDLRCVRAIKV